MKNVATEIRKAIKAGYSVDVRSNSNEYKNVQPLSKTGSKFAGINDGKFRKFDVACVLEVTINK